MKHIILNFLLLCTLIACNGGGGSSSSFVQQSFLREYQTNVYVNSEYFELSQSILKIESSKCGLDIGPGKRFFYTLEDGILKVFDGAQEFNYKKSDQDRFGAMVMRGQWNLISQDGTREVGALELVDSTIEFLTAPARVKIVANCR